MNLNSPRSIDDRVSPSSLSDRSSPHNFVDRLSPRSLAGKLSPLFDDEVRTIFSELNVRQIDSHSNQARYGRREVNETPTNGTSSSLCQCLKTTKLILGFCCKALCCPPPCCQPLVKGVRDCLEQRRASSNELLINNDHYENMV